MSVVDELIERTGGVKDTIGQSLDSTRAVIDKIGESMEELGAALGTVEESKTATDGLLNDITDAKQTTAGILGEDAVAGFVAAEQFCGELTHQLDAIRKAIEDLQAQFDAAKQETEVVTDQDTGAISTAESIISALKAQAGDSAS